MASGWRLGCSSGNAGTSQLHAGQLLFDAQDGLEADDGELELLLAEAELAAGCWATACHAQPRAASPNCSSAAAGAAASASSPRASGSEHSLQTAAAPEAPAPCEHLPVPCPVAPASAGAPDWPGLGGHVLPAPASAHAVLVRQPCGQRKRARNEEAPGTAGSSRRVRGLKKQEQLATLEDKLAAALEAQAALAEQVRALQGDKAAMLGDIARLTGRWQAAVRENAALTRAQMQLEVQLAGATGMNTPAPRASWC